MLVKPLSRIADGKWPIMQVGDHAWSELKARSSREFASLPVPGTVVAANDVGAFAYFSRLPILDFPGLDNSEICHLPKPEGVRNPWENARLDHAIEQEVDAE